MRTPVVSVVIPAHNQAEYLGEAIQSVLGQTVPDLEVIVVNDASRDSTDDVVGRFLSDARVKYIVHERNRGLPAARNTGIRASSAEIIALLDADDTFHPDKLAAHVEFLGQRPDVSVTYNPRFDIDPSGEILAIWRPPLAVSLPDFVMSFPFAPSDMVLRREPLFRVGLFDESYQSFSEDLDINCRLALAGCRFASVDRALNYRRFYPGRVIRSVSERLDAALRALETTFADARCTSDVLARRNEAIANANMIWSYEAFIGRATLLAQQLLHQAIRLDSSILDNGATRLLEFLIFRSVQDGGQHEEALGELFEQLPGELLWLTSRRDWAIAQGFVRRGARAAMFGDLDSAHRLLDRAARLGVQPDEPFSRLAVDQVLSCERELGSLAAERALLNLVRCLERIGSGRQARSIRALYSINRAFHEYRGGRHSRVPGRVLGAIARDPSYLADRGVLSILVRSVLQLGRAVPRPNAGSDPLPS